MASEPERQPNRPKDRKLNRGPSALEPPARPGRERIRLIMILGSLFAIGPLTIDMYLPALPAITE